MSFRLTLSVLIVLGHNVAISQENDTLRGEDNPGKFSAHMRTFFMSTINQGDLQDYYALAGGAGIGYESGEFRRFSVGISGFFVYNMLSSDLTSADHITGMGNRYEVGLFDATDPSNSNDLARLEELYVQYRVSKSVARFGKITLNTPFINMQDGRMRPTLAQGLWIEMKEFRNAAVYTGWITGMSPRSTVRWYDIGKSIGAYGAGIGEDGVKSGYSGNISSKGIAIGGLTLQNAGTRFALWNTFIENVSNNVFVQIEKDIERDGAIYLGGLQYVRQDAVGNGGNLEPSKAYISPASHANVFSARLGIRMNGFELGLNATLISDQSRFLMPREWGREPFYTFLSRERNEGYGNVKAMSTNLVYTTPSNRSRILLGAGHYDLPDVKNFRLNKYGIPSYAQFNAEVRHKFKGFLEGTTLQLLYVYKLKTGEDHGDQQNIFNKVNMSNLNVVLDHRFERTHQRRQLSAIK